MKKRLSTIGIYLISALLIVLAMLAIFFVFRSTAVNNMKNDISWDIDMLQASIRQQYLAVDGDTETFFRNVSAILAQNQDKGTMLVLNSDFDITRPNGEALKQARYMFAIELAAAIRSGSLDEGTFFSTGEGKLYYVNCQVYDSPDPDLHYLIIFKDITQEVMLIRSMNRELLIISLAAAAVMILLLLIPFQFMNQALLRLCAELERIAPDDTSPVVFTSHIREPERIRLAINRILDDYNTMSSRRESTMRSMRHELRNALTSIGGYAQGIELGVSPAVEAAGIIRTKSESMSSMLDNISLFNHMKSHPNLQSHVFSAAERAEACIEAFRNSADWKNISLTLQEADSRLMVSAAPELFDAVMNNLLSNAIRYAADAVTVAVSQDADRILISVSDNGSGIREQDMPHLFEQFYKGAGGQSGIGLAVAEEAAEAMGGTLTAQNRPGGGAVFTLSLPPAE